MSDLENANITIRALESVNRLCIQFSEDFTQEELKEMQDIIDKWKIIRSEIIAEMKI